MHRTPHLHRIIGCRTVWAVVALLMFTAHGIASSAEVAPVISRAIISGCTTTMAWTQHEATQESGHAADTGQPAAESEGHGAAEGEHGEVEAQRADTLAVHEVPAWYGPVVIGAAVLFLLAIVLGSAAVVMKGPEPADPPHAHGHDDHH